MVHTNTETRRITPQITEGTYDWSDDREVQKEEARAAYFRPQIDPEIRAAMERAAARPIEEAPLPQVAPEKTGPKHKADAIHRGKAVLKALTPYRKKH